MKIRQSIMVSIMLFVLAVSAQSQEKKEPKKTAGDDLIKVTTSLVNLDVIIKDKKGKVITDLKPEDFTVLENGVPQKIEFFDATLTNGNKAAQPKTATTSTEPGPRMPNGF